MFGNYLSKQNYKLVNETQHILKLSLKIKQMRTYDAVVGINYVRLIIEFYCLYIYT